MIAANGGHMLLPLIKKTSAFAKVEKVKNQFYEKFDAILSRLSAQEAVLASLAANDTSALQTLVYLVEHAQRQAQIQQQAQKELVRRLSEVERTSADAAERRAADAERRIATVEEGITALQRLLEREVELERERDATFRRAALAADSPGVDVHTRRFALLNPEVALLAYLADFLPTRRVLDVGAHLGDVSATLVAARCEVHAFEPNPPVLAQLAERFRACESFVAHGVAVGAEDGTMDLHLATDHSPEHWYEDVTQYSSLTPHALPPEMEFNARIAVQVRCLDSLHSAHEIPDDVSLVKIDTEGYDLEVIRGMRDHRYPVIVAEFWDDRMAFGKSGARNALPALVQEMHTRGSPWFIVIYRVFPSDEKASFYCNLPDAVESSWGNVVFFQDHEIFERARRWCSATLPEAVFHKRLVPARSTAQCGAAPVLVRRPMR